MYMELSSHPRILEKKIKPVAVPVGFKVVNGSRRIGNRQAVSNRIIPKRQRSSTRSCRRRNAWAGMRACGTQPELDLKDREAALAAHLQKRAGRHAGVRDAARIRGAAALAAAFAETLSEAFAEALAAPLRKPSQEDRSLWRACGRAERGLYKRSPPVACPVFYLEIILMSLQHSPRS